MPGVLLQLSLFSFVSAGLGLPCRACDWLPQCPHSTEVGLSARASHRINPWVPPMACLGIASGGVLKWLVSLCSGAHGFDIKFGLYRWDPGMGSKREMRAATPLLAGIYKELPDQVPISESLHRRHFLWAVLHMRGEHLHAALQPSPHQTL